MDAFELAAENKRDDGHQLDEDIQSRTRGVLEGVANSVADNCSLVNLTSLAHDVSSIVLHGATLDVLLSVVPSTSSVRSRDRQLDSTHNSTRQETGKDPGAESEAEQKRRENDLNHQHNTRQPGAIISRREEIVEILMQAL